MLKIEDVEGIGPLYGPEADGPGPAVAILHGSEGPGAGWSHRFAAILAAHGMRALPLAYGTGDVWGAGEIREVDIAALVEQGARLRGHPSITTLDLFGWSRGGELAMHMAAVAGAELPFRRVAAHAPADHCVPAFDIARMRRGEPRPEATADAGRAWVWAGQDDRLVPGRPIEIERFPRPVFLSVGAADEVWDHRMTLRLADRLATAGNPADLFVVEGQGHAYDFGVEPELWRRLLAFFRAP
ncbi:prolyl oligopeptidase family serine peptidase [Rhodobacterales bacterium HKCCE3408]|nr:prolyl oligopeptidase family serine peptidase [Rhodobacterales bacterium HKCCE3408]